MRSKDNNSIFGNYYIDQKNLDTIKKMFNLA